MDVKTKDERARLRKQLEEAQKELAKLEAQMDDRPDFGLGEADPMVYEYEMNLANRARLQEKIEHLEEALEKLESGSYGLCERCGRAIDPERLEILPETTLCIECAQRR